MGCSVGLSTRWLAQQYPNAAEVIGMDACSYFLAVAMEHEECVGGPIEREERARRALVGP